MKPQKKIKTPNPQEKELLKSRKELKAGKGKELKGLSQLDNPQGVKKI